MTILQANLATSLLLIALGVPLLFNHPVIRRLVLRFPRSKTAAGITMVLGTAWFLMAHVGNLSNADFGEYKILITVLSLLILVLSYIYLPDFLAVRGASILVLLFAREALDAAFQQYQYPSRLFMVSVVYLAIMAALYFSAWPYRLHDFLEWMFHKDTRSRTMGTAMVCFGVLLGIIAFGY
ncbi:MAG: hypothetical protein CMI32_07350 [Opitutales bacterium]|nr:hypothetical protein [Opitutales bacterium]|tara:strand:+ start:1832 stop:2374 length:543 start_codon:yes stop_codon:yes gene_type:complete